ncbi:MAG: thioredoxin domain-containing protein [Acidobacteria bacterium]|nr:thioredoxin domain-containing protein [Acidobacteriota bacterium]
MSEHKFTNHLIHETSPYLIQHAHNPVDWYPWGDEALEKSRQEDKPILLSVGYAACHWCHVMEGESFENEAIAQVMNENFVCIKVDREERPDIDAIYMNAVQMLTGHGGWPMTVFLTPDLKPYYGGTYFPPVDRQGMPGFPRVLLAMAEAYQTKRDEVTSSADAITAELQKTNRFTPSDEILTSEVFNQAYAALLAGFDKTYGGFGRAPKFPPSMALMFLLRYVQRTNTPEALHMVEVTLHRMANGGMYDHLGGGFARYSVDNYWLVPHFEKMLYDNALLARVYLQAYQATKRPLYRRVAEEILEYVMRDLTDRAGGFYSSEDADSEGEEGKFYVWTKAEVLEILGGEDGEIFCEFYDITETGNFEHGQSILNSPHNLDSFAERKNLTIEALKQILSGGRKKLFYVREHRLRPLLDNKILTAWNGLMLTAFAEAANILGRDDYRLVAQRNADFLLANSCKDGRLLRTCKDGQAKLNGYVEDYAFLIEGLLAVYEATFEVKYFTAARTLADTMIEQFWDDQEQGFFFTSKDHEALITRTKDYFDNAIPSGNSVAALALQKISLLTADSKYQSCALAILRVAQPFLSRYPNAFGFMLCALDFYLSEPKEIAIIGSLEAHEVRLFIEEIYARFLPNKVLAAAEANDSSAGETIKLLAEKSAIEDQPTVYVCRNYTCLSPVNTPAELAERLIE